MSNQQPNQLNKKLIIDHFLYSCYEQNKVFVSQSKTNSTTLLTWPEISSLTSETMQERSLKELINSLIGWYKEKFNFLSTKKKLEDDVILKISEPLCAISRDIDIIYRLKCEEEIPYFEFSVGNNKIWEMISDAINTAFPHHGQFYNKYVEWSHCSEKPLTDNKLSQRAPVGRFIPILNKSANNYKGNNSNRGIKANRTNSQRSQYGNTKNANINGNAKYKKPFNKKPKHNKEQTAKLEKLALAELDTAIASLNTQSELDEVRLKPQNSFYRRLQHKKAVELGYRSFSVGEGDDRSVRIERSIEEDE